MKRAFRLMLWSMGIALLAMVTQAATPLDAEGPTPEAVVAPTAPAPAAAMGAPGEVKVLYSACTPGQPSGPGLFVADSDFADPVRISSPTVSAPDGPAGYKGCDSGAWSPDGRRVVLSRTGLLNMLELRTIGEFPDQQPAPVLTPDGNPIVAWSPSWSPDGQWITFHVMTIHTGCSSCGPMEPAIA